MTKSEGLNMRRSSVFLVVALGLLACLGQPLFADSSLATTPADEVRRIQQQQQNEFNANLQRYLSKLIKDYELGGEVQKAYREACDDDKFIESLDSQGISAENLTFEHVVEYLRKSGKTKPEVLAWMQLVSNRDKSWPTSLGFYEEIRKVRPKDYEPLFFLLCKSDPVTEDEQKRWLELVNEVWQLAQTEDRRCICFLLVSSSSFRIAGKRNSEATLSELDRWLTTLATKNEGEKEVVDLSRFSVALARGRCEEAAEISRKLAEHQPDFRTVEAILLVCAKKFDKAKAVLVPLSQDPTLPAEKRELVDSLLAWLQKIPEGKPAPADKAKANEGALST